jgi:hypothetical protein
LHGLRRRFEQSHDAQAGDAVRKRLLRRFDAADELRHLDAKRFPRVQLGRGHIAHAVLNHFLKYGFGLFGDADALIVDFDFFAGLDVVVNDHLAIAAQQRAADLDRRQPIHVDMGDQILVEEAGHVGDGLAASRQMPDSGSGDRARHTGQKMIHDREVVHGQIPDHVHVGLE